ncbi:MAG: helix-turn-helix domain-containing protein, partial [Terracidiphilus sp.]
VRELENAMQHGSTFSTGGVIHLGDLTTLLKNRGAQAQQAAAESGDGSGAGHDANVKSLQELEREAILAAIRTLKGDKLQAARMLGIGKTTLYRKLKEYGIADPLHEE